MCTQMEMGMMEGTTTAAVYGFERMVSATTEFEEVLESSVWMTPEHEGSKIRERTTPPPAPKKKRWNWGFGGKKPKQVYFNPPDLEMIFKVAPPPRRTREQVCA